MELGELADRDSSRSVGLESGRLGPRAAAAVSAAPHTPYWLFLAAAASVIANVGADADWVATLHELDGTWEQDWPRTIAVLETFIQRWPDYAPARDKLYAALVADADLDIQSGQADAGLAELKRAAAPAARAGRGVGAVDRNGQLRNDVMGDSNCSRKPRPCGLDQLVG